MSNKKHKPQIIARESVLKVIYQLSFNDTSSKEILNNFVEKREYDKDLFKQLLDSYISNKTEISNIIRKNNERIDNIPIIDQCIISLGICEYKYINNTKNMIISEYINIAKKYSSPKMYTYLNKILDKIMQ